MENQIIPIKDVYNQTFEVILGKQNCRINLHQCKYGLFCDLYVDDSLILGGVICQNDNRIVRDVHFGFVGDLVFHDTMGTSDPSSPGLGTRYVLAYVY